MTPREAHPQPLLNRAMGGEQDADYARALTACASIAEVRELVHTYRELAVDAFSAVNALTEADWKEFRRGLRSERRGKYAGDAWAARFGAILMPLPMMRVTEIAAQFNCPFGVAWARCKDLRPDLLEVAK